MVAMLGVAGLNIYRNRKQHRESVEAHTQYKLIWPTRKTRLVEGQQRVSRSGSCRIRRSGAHRR